jgi:ribosomal protein L7Ae-like RNA K-turn-binding protein|tara:strand:- start:114 stop:347 length:234 start_codon:yes stop_codon:yes gene_type:complete
MSVNDIRKAMSDGTAHFGIRQAVKGKKKAEVFIARDTRDVTIEKLEKHGIEFSVLKSKGDLTKELNLDFECEVISLY